MEKGVFFWILVIIISVGLGPLGGWIFMLLWNWLLPLFWASAPILNIWQGVGIIILLNIIGNLLFGSKNK